LSPFTPTKEKWIPCVSIFLWSAAEIQTFDFFASAKNSRRFGGAPCSKNVFTYFYKQAEEALADVLPLLAWLSGPQNAGESFLFTSYFVFYE